MFFNNTIVHNYGLEIVCYNNQTYIPINIFLFSQSKKPLMEKRRRARINNCLVQLKSLVLQAMKKDVSTYILYCN